MFYQPFPKEKEIFPYFPYIAQSWDNFYASTNTLHNAMKF